MCSTDLAYGTCALYRAHRPRLGPTVPGRPRIPRVGHCVSSCSYMRAHMSKGQQFPATTPVVNLIMDGPTALNVLTLSTEQTPHSGAGDDPHLSDLNARARRAIEAEHSSSISSAFFKHPWACFWSLAMTMCVVMFGYDTTLVNSFYAYPSFIEKFGVYDEKTGAKAITTHWMTSINVSLSCGELVGLWCSGFFMERYGHRRVLIFSFILLCAFIFLEFFAQSLAMLLVAEFLMAFPWGIFTVLGTAYSSEVCPLRLRGYMTSFTQIAATIGQLIGSGVLLGSVNNLSTWSWRIPFAVQWVSG